MTSRVLREIPLKILHRKVGDEHVTLLQACYDNPIFNEDDAKGFPTHNGSSRTGKAQDYGADVFEDGVDPRGPAYATSKRTASCHVANDYMHSLPPSHSLPNDIAFRAHRKRSRLFILLLVCLLVVVAMTIGLLVFFLGGDSASSSSSSSSPVITLASIEGSLTIVAGPFASYDSVLANSSSPAFLFIRNAFVFTINKIFMSSHFANMYNTTEILRMGNSNGHVLVTFVVRVKPNSTASLELVHELKDVVESGFYDSLFVVDKTSIKLIPKRLELPAIPEDVPLGQCQPIVFSKCANETEYSYTSFPNFLGHKSPQESENAYLQSQPLVQRQCYGYYTDYFCSLWSPECGTDGRPIPPCKRYCLDMDAACNTTTLYDCDKLPDSEDPNVCRQNPYHQGECVPVENEYCKNTFNQTAYPNIFGGVTDDPITLLKLSYFDAIQNATSCHRHSMLFGCALYNPPCSGKPYPDHNIPPCQSLCQTYKDRCQIFWEIFDQQLPPPFNCSLFPDSPDPSVCIGYHEAREPEIIECRKGQIKCGQDRCIETAWMCDGFQDCDDNSDEIHCASCGPHEQTCSPASSLCIDKTQGCNGANDCYMDVDEHFCVRMDTEHENDVLEVFNSVSSAWEEICQEGWTQEFSELACKQLGYKTVLATYYKAESGAKKSKVGALRNGSDPDRLQSYVERGYSKCSSGYVVRLVCWETECGIRPAYFKSALRVVGGDEVMPGTWPWMVSLHGGSGRRFFCGGTIIHPEWVLTAAHCVGGAYSDGIKNYWTVMTGNTRRVAYSEFRQIRGAKQLFNHPNFTLITVENDLALIHLDKPLAMNDFVRPVCLPEKELETGSRCYATGWGKSKNFVLEYEPAMLQVPLDVTSWDHCSHAIKSTSHPVPYKLTKAMFCAGGAHGHDACQGDSGGPLVCLKENTTDQWYQGGIVSWGVVCGQPNIPGVYTNLPLYVDWINEVIANYTDNVVS